MDPAAKNLAWALLIAFAIAGVIVGWGLWQVMGLVPRRPARWLLRAGFVCVAPGLVTFFVLFSMRVLAGGRPYGVDRQGHYLLIEKGVVHVTPRRVYVTMERLAETAESAEPWMLLGAGLAIIGAILSNRSRAEEADAGDTSDPSSVK